MEDDKLHVLEIVGMLAVIGIIMGAVLFVGDTQGNIHSLKNRVAKLEKPSTDKE